MCVCVCVGARARVNQPSISSPTAAELQPLKILGSAAILRSAPKMCRLFKNLSWDSRTLWNFRIQPSTVQASAGSLYQPVSCQPEIAVNPSAVRI